MAGVYVLFSVAWILSTDALLAHLVTEPSTLTALSSLKGIVYIAITAAGLFIALMAKRGPESGTVSDGVPTPVPLISIFAIVTIVALVLGGWFFRHLAAAQKHEAIVQLSAVAELKTALIQRWLNEYSAQARILMETELLAEQLKSWMSAPDGSLRNRIEHRLTMLRKVMDADAVLLTDTQGIVRMSRGEHLEPVANLRDHIRSALSGYTPRILTMYADRDRGGELVVHVVIPLATDSRNPGSVAGAVVVSREARRFVDSILGYQAVPGWAGSTLLALRQGDKVAILVPATTNSPMSETFIRNTSTGTAEAQAALAPGSDVTGNNHADVPVFAASRAVGGTDWILISQIPQDDVHGETRRIAVLVAGVTASMILVFGMLLSLQWRQQRAHFELRVAAADRRNATLLRHYAQIADNINDIVLLVDETGTIVDVNDRAISAYGHARAEIVGRPLSDLCADPGGCAKAMDAEGLAEGRVEAIQRRRDGSTFPAEVVIRRITDESAQFRQFVLRDISVQRETEQRFRSYVEHAPVAVIVIESGRISEANPAAGELFGYPRGELQGMPIAALQTEDDHTPLVSGAEAIGNLTEAEHRLRHATGRPILAIVRGVTLPDGRGLVFIQNITRRVEAEEALRESERKFRSLVEQSISGIYIIQDRRVAYANPRAAEISGRRHEELLGMEVLELIAENDRPIVAEKLLAIESGEITEVPLNVAMLRPDGSTVDVGTHSSVASYNGRPAIIGVMQDITERLVVQEREREYLLHLEKSMLGTIDSVSRMVDLRDPYTAGHEHRVGELAAAIGQEMGLDERAQRGLRIIGYVHDIGKIAIPAEILSKPTRLTRAEMDMIKTHSQAGYDILGDVEFPWPVAEAIRQHHERIDGSGYPLGLKGGDILLEARIIGVADTIEAMSSHRPYRPGKGLEQALAEIEKTAGILYDPDVVKAALRLFRDRRYELPT